MTKAAEPHLAAVEAALCRAVAVARLGPRAPLADRERARAVLAHVEAVPSMATRMLILTRCTPCPPAGDLTPWQNMASDTGVLAADLKRLYTIGLSQVAASLDIEPPA